MCSPIDPKTILPLLTAEIEATCTQLDKQEERTLALYALSLYEAWFSFNLACPIKTRPVRVDAVRLLAYAKKWFRESIEMATIFLRILDLASQAGRLDGDVSVEEMLPFLLSFSHQVSTPHLL